MQCPDCAGTFRMDLPPGTFPDFCPLCAAYVGVDPDFVPSQMNIGSGRTRSIDGTYREMEAASAARAEAFGQPAMKMTDMKDGLREGDVAAAPPQPSQDYKEAVARAGVEGAQFQGGAMGQPEAVQAAIAGARVGPRASQGTGAGVLSVIQGGGSAPKPASPLVRGGFG